MIKQYDKYTASGVEWLGEIPEHWDVKRVKDLGEYQSGYFIDADEFNNHNEYPVFGGNGLRGYACKYNHNGEYILIGRQGALCGNINFAKGKFWATEHAVVVYSRSDVHKRWYAYLLDVMNLNQYAISAAQPGLSVDKIKRLMLPFTELNEQTAIANYLDIKTAAIDRKIELLTAKAAKYKALRRSLINETVCRGLNTNVPMKDSGIEWIGMIPEHWEVKRVKEIFRNTGSGTTPPSGDQTYYDDNGFNWLQTGDLNDSFITETSKKISQKAVAEFSTLNRYSKNSLVIAMYGATIGKMGYLNIDTTTNQACCVLTNPIGNNSQYLFYQLLSMKQFIISLSTGGGQPNINQDIVRFLRLCVPDLQEQTAIANYLDSKTTQIDIILTNISTQISKLTQLRKTLINDVVTGQLKVTE